MISIPDQPRVERLLRRALDRESPPQQFLLSGPPGTGKRAAARAIAWHLIAPGEEPPRGGAHFDLTVVTPAGNTIRLEDELDPALRALAARPHVGLRRVVIIEHADRLSERDSAPRILKALEEPPVRSHLVLVTDHLADVLPTIRSRCLPVPFRAPSWATVAERLRARGVPDGNAAALARSFGAAALRSDAFDLGMCVIGVDLGVKLVTGPTDGRVVLDIQTRMAQAAAGRASEELHRLRAEADALAGKRGEKTARKRADEQEKREVRRAVTDGWVNVLDGAAGLVADAIALAVGAERYVRNVDRLDAIRPFATRSQLAFLEHAAGSIGQLRTELELNPTIDAAVLAMLIRIGDGPSRPRNMSGRLSVWR